MVSDQSLLYSPPSLRSASINDIACGSSSLKCAEMCWCVNSGASFSDFRVAAKNVPSSFSLLKLHTTNPDYLLCTMKCILKIIIIIKVPVSHYSIQRGSEFQVILFTIRYKKQNWYTIVQIQNVNYRMCIEHINLKEKYIGN